jgi:hypothetical protein
MDIIKIGFVGVDWIQLVHTGLLAGCCENSTELTDSTKRGKFLDWLDTALTYQE